MSFEHYLGRIHSPIQRFTPAPEVAHYIVQPNLWSDEVVKSPLNSRAAEDGVCMNGYSHHGHCISPVSRFRGSVGKVGSAECCLHQLTKLPDRLVAIAGVARELSPILGDRYAVGLWAQSLPWSLTWFIGSNGTGQAISTGYSTHTFSWTKVAHTGRMSLPSGPTMRPNMCEDRVIASAAFVHYREKIAHPDSTARRPPDANSEILKDDIFGPISSPEVEVRIQGF